MDTTSLNQRFEQSLFSLERVAPKMLYRESGLGGTAFIDQVVIPTLERIGTRWENGTAALSQVYMSGKICEELVDELLPPNAAERKNQPRMAIAVFEDYHLLGKRIVYAVLRAAGYELLDYGRMQSSQLLKRINDDNIEVILLSTLMLPSALRMKTFCSTLRESNHQAKVVVGGAPFRFDPQLWTEIGADAMAYTASDAITVLKTFSPAESVDKL